MFKLLPKAAITAKMLVTATMMIIRPWEEIREEIKGREKHHWNIRHQIQIIFPPKKIQSRKAILLKAADFKLSLNLRIRNESFLVKWQIMSITSLSVLF